MHIWKQEKDGWNYCQDRSQRWKRMEDGRVACESVPHGESLTQQQFKDDTDVNVIMEKFMKTGQIGLHVPPMLEGDFTELPSYQEALHTVMAANDMFMEIPAKTRLQFENDPQKLMDFLADPNNTEEAIKLGLKVKAEEPKPDLHLETLKSIQENTKPRKPKSSED